MELSCQHCTIRVCRAMLRVEAGTMVRRSRAHRLGDSSRPSAAATETTWRRRLGQG